MIEHALLYYVWYVFLSLQSIIIFGEIVLHMIELVICNKPVIITCVFFPYLVAVEIKRT